MNLNINIQHKIDEELGEYMDISFNNGGQTLFMDIIRKQTSTKEVWAKALQFQSEPLEFIDCFLTMKR